ncbi:MAG: ATP-binding protein [Thermoplasmata archaeon]
MSFFVLIRGPLGVGKTTVATRVATELGARYVSIDGILDRPGVEEWDGERITEASFLRVNRIAAADAGPLLARGIPVIFDGNFYYESQVEDLIRALSSPHEIFTLTAPLEECIARDRQRGHSYGAGATRDVFELVGRFAVGIAVDARRPISATVEEIVERVRSTFRLPTPRR